MIYICWQQDNFQKLIHLQSRLGNCEIIKPGRYIKKEGELDKVSRKMLQPRYFILVTKLFNIIAQSVKRKRYYFSFS